MSRNIFELLDRLSVRPAKFAAGSFLFHIDDPVRFVHFVQVGTINLVRCQTDGAQLVLQRAGQGSILAESSLFSERYHCDAIAITAAETLSVPKMALRRLVCGDEEFATAWVKHMSREVQHARLQAEIMSIKTVKGRLDAWLALRGKVPPKGEWNALAGEIGVSPEALYRELAKRR